MKKKKQIATAILIKHLVNCSEANFIVITLVCKPSISIITII